MGGWVGGLVYLGFVDGELVEGRTLHAELSFFGLLLERWVDG